MVPRQPATTTTTTRSILSICLRTLLINLDNWIPSALPTLPPPSFSMFHFSRKRNSNGRHNRAYYILKITTSFLPRKRAPWINQFNHEQTTGRYFSEAREAVEFIRNICSKHGNERKPSSTSYTSSPSWNPHFISSSKTEFPWNFFPKNPSTLRVFRTRKCTSYASIARATDPA